MYEKTWDRSMCANGITNKKRKTPPNSSTMTSNMVQTCQYNIIK